MKNTIYSIALVSLLLACGQDKGDVTTLEEEVSAIHDELMLHKMDKIMELQNTLSTDITRMDSLLKIKVDTALANRKEKALILSSALEKADSGMMDWMHNYNSDTLKVLQKDDAMKYLETQKKIISTVRDLTNSSIGDAEGFLKK